MKVETCYCNTSYLLGIVLEGQETDVSEQGLEDGGPYVRPVQHPLELGGVDHVALERRQEYLGCVGEDDDAEADRKVLHVHRPPHHAPAPVADLQQTVAQDDCVYQDMRHCAPEG